MPANEAALTAAIWAEFPTANITRLGCGGFACTFRVREGAEDLAVKVIDPQQVGNPLREEREVLALQNVHDPCVVPYRGTGTIDHGGQTYRYLKMDFVEGQPLSHLFASGQSFSADELAMLTEDIVNGGVAIWAAGLAHRDLSPNNVLVKSDGHAVIVDLGLARHLNLPTLTTTLPTPGTPGWMSPEQVDANPERGDWQSDQFVIGLLLYRAATGVDPFSGATAYHLWRAPLERTPLPARFLNPSLPRRAGLLIGQLTEREAFRRYMNPQDLLDDTQLAAQELRAGVAVAAPSRPLRFLLSLGEKKSYLEPAFFTALAADHLVLDARGVTPVDAPGWMAAAQQEQVVGMVDPVNYFDKSPPSARPAHYLRLPYASDTEPAITGTFATDAEREDYARPIVEYQVSAGARIIVAPYFFADVAQTGPLEESLGFGAVAKRLLADAGQNKPVWTPSRSPRLGCAKRNYQGCSQPLRTAGQTCSTCSWPHHNPRRSLTATPRSCWGSGPSSSVSKRKAARLSSAGATALDCCSEPSARRDGPRAMTEHSRTSSPRPADRTPGAGREPTGTTCRRCSTQSKSLRGPRWSARTRPCSHPPTRTARPCSRRTLHSLR